MNNFLLGSEKYGSGMFGQAMMPASFLAYLLFFALWTLFWKGMALWHAAGRKQGGWFIALLLINTAGILEIIYLFGVLKLKRDQLFPKQPKSNQEKKP